MKKILVLFLFFIGTLNATVKADIKTGLVADFPFSGGAFDVSGNHYRAQINGGLTLTEDRFENKDSAYKFNNGFIQTTVNGGKITNAMSVSFWLKTSHSCYRGLLGYCGSNRPSFIFSTSSDDEKGHYYKYISNSNIADDLTTTYVTYDNKWHHIVVTFSQTYTSMFIDGLYQNRKAVDSFSFTGDVFKFGKEKPSSGSEFPGALDDIKIYNRVLTDDDVWKLFKENSLKPLNLVLDIDGDGLIKPLSDSLLILRYNFGFKDNVLIDNAVSDKCTRCTSNEITNYLDELFNSTVE